MLYGRSGELAAIGRLIRWAVASSIPTAKPSPKAWITSAAPTAAELASASAEPAKKAVCD
jgi:hypothetical protein